MARPLRVLVEARLARGTAGGVETVLMGLVDGFTDVQDDVHATLLVDGRAHDWISTRLSPNSELLVVESGSLEPSTGRRWRSIAKSVVPPDVAEEIRTTARTLRGTLGGRHLDALIPAAPIDTGRFDVVHFPFQTGFRTSTPFVFQPHDLQHLHLPQFFTWRERARRTAVYRSLCDKAAVVMAASRWVAEDISRNLGTDPAKIRVVNLAPLPRPIADPEQLGPLDLPREFAYYPAATWPHKNHATLLRAVAALKKSGLVVPLVFTGHLTPHYRGLARLVGTLGLEDQVRFLGFVDDEVVAALYARARVVVIPTLFEAGSFPLWEAFEAATPVVCARVTSLPEQAGQGALMVNPLDVDDLAEAIHLAWSDEDVRKSLTTEGKRRLADVSWAKTARRVVAVYRLAAGQATDGDLDLLNQPTAF